MSAPPARLCARELPPIRTRHVASQLAASAPPARLCARELPPIRRRHVASLLAAPSHFRRNHMFVFTAQHLLERTSQLERVRAETRPRRGVIRARPTLGRRHASARHKWAGTRDVTGRRGPITRARPCQPPQGGRAGGHAQDGAKRLRARATKLGSRREARAGRARGRGAEPGCRARRSARARLATRHTPERQQDQPGRHMSRACLVGSATACASTSPSWRRRA